MGKVRLPEVVWELILHEKLAFSSECVCAKSLSHVQLFATPWTVARQVPLCKGFSRQEYWRVLPFSPPGDLLNPGIEPESPAAPALQANYLPLRHQGSPYVYIQFSSVVQLCPTLCDQASLSITNSWSLLKLMSIKFIYIFKYVYYV